MVPELYTKTKAAAALAAASHPHTSATASPLHHTLLPVRQVEEAHAAREPGVHSQGVAEPSARQPVNDMFRSNRQQTSVTAFRHVRNERKSLVSAA